MKKVGGMRSSFWGESDARPPVRRPPAVQKAGWGTYVQPHQREQVPFGCSEDGVCLPAGHSLIRVALQVVEDRGGRLCNHHALLGLERRQRD